MLSIICYHPIKKKQGGNGGGGGKLKLHRVKLGQISSKPDIITLAHLHLVPCSFIAIKVGTYINDWMLLVRHTRPDIARCDGGCHRFTFNFFYLRM